MTATSSPRAFVNGRIFTVDAARPWAEALLVRGGRIALVGDTAAIRAGAGEGAEIVDLAGRFVMPGIHDAHSHMLFSGLKHRFDCRLSPTATADDFGRQLCDCVSCSSGKLGDWVIGGDFNPLLSEAGTLDRDRLDRLFPDRPVYLHDYTLHHGLANSKALELAGIDASTPDPEGGRIVRRAGSDEPTGELVERATWKIFNVMPERESDVYLEAMRWAVATASRFGVTSVQEASATRPELAVLKQLDDEGALPLRVAAHIPWREEHFGMAPGPELDRLIAERARYAGRCVHTDFVKVFMDGSPLGPHFTEARLDPATGRPEAGKVLITREDLAAALIAWDGQGITAKIHCTGDAAVQIALQAIGDMRAASDGGTIQEISHCCFVAEDDLDRFAALDVTAELSPPIWFGDIPELVEFRDSGYPIGSLDRRGARMTVGSDWIFLPEPNLFPALGGLLERPGQSVTLDKAIAMMTLNGARAIGLGQETGSIEAGKSADFIVLDTNPFEVPREAIAATQVLLTVFEGRTVHEAA